MVKINPKTGKPPRKTDRPSDKAYNARRRLKRAAEKLKNQASNATGMTKQRLEHQANELLGKVQKTYQVKGEYKFDVDRLENYTEKMFTGVDEEKLTQVMLSGAVGKRIYAATVSIWKDSDLPINEAIKQHFGVETMSEVVDWFENRVSDLYENTEVLKQENYNDPVILEMEKQIQINQDDDE